MNKTLLFTLIISFFTLQLNAQCSENDETKVLLIGDSWAFFMYVDGTIDNVFEKWGHTHYKFLSNPTVAENGAETDDFQGSSKQTEIQNLINDNPSIEAIHLSIAGNDVLGDWNVNFTQAQLDELIDSVYARTLDVVNFLKSTKPGIKIVFSGYVYPNFEEILTVNNPLGNSHPFYGTWNSMGQPTFLQINTILNDFSTLMEDYANTEPQVEFYKAPALMQYTFGQNDVLGVAPGGTYPPFTQPLPFGDPSYPSPKESMRDYLGITRDCFHLSPKGYRDLIGYHTQKFYHKFLMDDQYLLSTLSNDGSVSSAQNVSNDLILGKNGSEDFATVLNFNTQNMDWQKVTNAEIFLRIEEITGDNPLSSPVEVSVKSGNLGSTITIDAADYTANTDMDETPCVFGSNNQTQSWIRIELPATMNEFITKNSNTQFLIKSTSTTDGTVKFTNASDSDFAPVLNLKYDTTYTSIKNINEESTLVLFPNPAEHILRINKNEASISSIKIYNSLGQLCLQQQNNSTSINVESLNSGFYKVAITMDSKVIMRNFVKK
ncbi:MAG: SGNH/GDSL hydrolase family protein [Chitinophagales bacterium]